MAHDRRGFLSRLVGWGSAVFGGLLAIPATGYLIDPLRRTQRGRADFIPVARLASLSADRPVKVNVETTVRDAWMVSPARRVGAVWLLRKGDEVRAWTVVCPHLGCAVDYRSEASRFVCPCHDSAFDGDGRRVSGPSARDMDRLDVRVADGVVSVRFVRFRKGIATRETV